MTSGFPTVGKQVAVLFYRCVGRPCGTSVDDVAEVFEDVYSAAVAGYGQGVVQCGGLGSCMGTDGEPSARHGDVAVYSLDLVVVKTVCRGCEDARYLIPLLKGVFGCAKQRVIGRYAGAVFDCRQPHVDFFKHHL